MSYSLNSLKGVIWGILRETIIRDIEGDTRTLDYGSYELLSIFLTISTIG